MTSRYVITASGERDTEKNTVQALAGHSIWTDSMKRGKKRFQEKLDIVNQALPPLLLLPRNGSQLSPIRRWVTPTTLSESQLCPCGKKKAPGTRLRCCFPGHRLGNILPAWAAIHFQQMTNKRLAKLATVFFLTATLGMCFWHTKHCYHHDKTNYSSKKNQNNRPKRYKVIVRVRAGELLRWVAYKIA